MIVGWIIEAVSDSQPNQHVNLAVRDQAKTADDEAPQFSQDITLAFEKTPNLRTVSFMLDWHSHGPWLSDERHPCKRSEIS
jgi:hypothetical protein